MPVRLIASLLLVSSLAAFSPAQEKKNENEKAISRIAFGSCIHQDRDQSIWGPIVATKPELFLFLGDNIYGDSRDIDVLKAKYKKLANQPGYKKLLSTCPILATWDDHDYGENDAGVEYPKKKESQTLFLDHFGVAKDSPRRTQEGIYSASVHGPAGKRVQVILLDTRYHRTALKADKTLPRDKGQYVANEDEKATYLGEKQWRWLEEQLKQPAELRLIGSSIQVVAQDHGFEKWANMPRERTRLFRTIKETNARGVVLLSGDRHLAELSVMDAGVGYPIYDLTSSGMNMANRSHRPLEPNKHRVAIMDVGNNFGMVRVDWTKADPLVALEIHDSDGDVTIRQKFPLSRLGGEKPVKGVVAEARKHLNKEWTVELTILSTGASSSGSVVFLNTEKEYRDESNFAVVLDMKALARELEQAKIKEPREHFLDKKVRVTGTVELYRRNLQIKVTQLKQIKVVE